MSGEEIGRMERRGELRAHLVVPAQVRVDDERWIDAYVENLSCSGVQLVGHGLRFEPGVPLRMAMRLPGAPRKLYVSGTVAWSDQGRIGIAFHDQASEQAMQIRQTVARITEEVRARCNEAMEEVRGVD